MLGRLPPRRHSKRPPEVIMIRSLKLFPLFLSLCFIVAGCQKPADQAATSSGNNTTPNQPPTSSANTPTPAATNAQSAANQTASAPAPAPQPIIVPQGTAI